MQPKDDIVYPDSLKVLFNAAKQSSAVSLRNHASRLEAMTWMEYSNMDHVVMIHPSHAAYKPLLARCKEDRSGLINAIYLRRCGTIFEISLGCGAHAELTPEQIIDVFSGIEV